MTVDVAGVLAGSLARANALLEWHVIVPGPPAASAEPSWVACSDLLADGGVELDRWLANVRRQFEAPPETAVSYVLGWCAAAVAAPAAALLVAERRLPALDPDRLWLHRTAEHWVDATAVDTTRVTVVAGDPLSCVPATASVEAGAPAGVDVVGTVDDLRRALVTSFAAALDPLVDAMSTRARLGRRVRCALVGHGVATMALQAGRGLGDPAFGRAEADAIFDVAGSSLAGRPGWITVAHGGRDHVFSCRSVCCLAYKTPAHRYCATCPSTPDNERIRRILAYVDGGGL